MSDDYTYPGYCLNNVPFSKRQCFSIYSDCIPARILNKFSTINKAEKIVKYIYKNGIQVFLNNEVNIDPNRYVKYNDTVYKNMYVIRSPRTNLLLKCMS